MRKLINLKGLSKEDWLAQRKKGIGGSDISSIMGLNKYKSALELYLDKTGQLPESDEENLAAELGLELEDFLAKKFVKWLDKEKGKVEEIIKPDCIYQDDTIDYFLVNFDRLIKDDVLIPVELKTTNEFNRDEWKDDEVPDAYFLQCQWQMMICDAPYCYLAYLIGNRTFNVKTIPRNQKVIDNLIKQAKIFWEEFVLKEIPPAPDGSMSAKDALNIIYADDKSDEPLDLTKDLKLDYEAYKINRGQAKALDNQANEIKQRFMALMGNNTFATVTIDDKVKKIRYRNIDRAGYTVEPKTFKQFNIY